LADIITSWLDNASRFPVLPQEQIIQLAKRRDALLYKAENLIDEAAKAKYKLKYRKLVNKIVQHNLLLIPSVVRQFVYKRPHLTMTSECIPDLFQYGVTGLNRAAEKFDPHRGYTFSTYALPWIKQSVGRGGHLEERLIYIPEGTAREAIYWRNYGTKSPYKGGTKNKEILGQAIQAMGMESLDKPQQQEKNHEKATTCLMEVISQENSMYESHPLSNASFCLDKLCDDAKLSKMHRQIIFGRLKGQRFLIIGAKTKMSTMKAKTEYDKAMRILRKHVGKQRKTNTQYDWRQLAEVHYN